MVNGLSSRRIISSISKKTGFTPALLKWYDANIRAFPWRLTKNPYHVWLSEIMLQQTQLKTIIPYYKRWLKDLSNINAVARVDLNYVLKKCTSIWLDAPINVINRRIKQNTKRPLLGKKNNHLILEKIYKERKNIYKLADHKINCDVFNNKEDIAKKIVEIYEKQ